MLTTAGITVLIDPVLVGTLDFGVPALYSASKRVLGTADSTAVSALPPLDALILTQGLDDHAHLRTLRAIATRDPALPVLAPPSARPVLEAAGLRSVTYLASSSRRLELPYLGLDALPPIRMPPSAPSAGLEHMAFIAPRRASIAATRGATRGRPATTRRGGVLVTATSGALVGPPWQRRENGYVLRATSSQGEATRADPRGASAGLSVYIEPHVEFDEAELQSIGPVDALPSASDSASGSSPIIGLPAIPSASPIS